MKLKTWKVLSWPLLPVGGADGSLSLCCPKCGRDASLPTRGQSGDLLIAALGLNLVFDNPGHKPPDVYMPESVQCRGCRTVFVADRSDK